LKKERKNEKENECFQKEGNIRIKVYLKGKKQEGECDNRKIV